MKKLILVIVLAAMALSSFASLAHSASRAVAQARFNVQIEILEKIDAETSKIYKIAPAAGINGSVLKIEDVAAFEAANPGELAKLDQALEDQTPITVTVEGLRIVDVIPAR